MVRRSERSLKTVLVETRSQSWNSHERVWSGIIVFNIPKRILKRVKHVLQEAKDKGASRRRGTWHSLSLFVKHTKKSVNFNLSRVRLGSFFLMFNSLKLILFFFQSGLSKRWETFRSQNPAEIFSNLSTEICNISVEIFAPSSERTVHTGAAQKPGRSFW